MMLLLLLLLPTKIETTMGSRKCGEGCTFTTDSGNDDGDNNDMQ